MHPDGQTRALLRLFKRRKIVRIEELLATLKTTSRMTVFRRLSPLGYLASCSHAGRFYTLKTVPEYDPHGLWRYTDVLFSRFGTLKETVRHLVETSLAGQYHRELESPLQRRVHNPLADLVDGEWLRREQIAGEYLYLSRDAARAKIQLAHRARLIDAQTIKEYPPVLVIEVLLEVIHSAPLYADSDAVAGRLRDRGVIVLAADVAAILQQHGVVKKTARSRSTHSPS